MIYQSDEFERMAQRFINTIFIKDELGDIHFSSTSTFVRYKNEHFTIFAAHAIPNRNGDIASMGHLGTDGRFYPLIEIIKGHKVYDAHDLVICNTLEAIHLKNYFDLDKDNSLIGFKKNIMNWIGFPKKKAIDKYHRTKSTEEHIKADISVLNDGIPKWNNANYLMVASKIKANNNIEIIGEFKGKKVTYKYESYKENAYSLKGMSGGAIFFEPNSRDIADGNLHRRFRFAGIGLEHRNNKDIKGASRKLVIDLLNDYIENRANDQSKNEINVAIS